MAWIGVDFDGTLAYHISGTPLYPLPKPVPAMVSFVRGLIDSGDDVRLLTARAVDFTSDQKRQLEEWCEVNLGKKLKITASKDYDMSVLYDDRAVQVEKNTGRIIGES